MIKILLKNTMTSLINIAYTAAGCLGVIVFKTKTVKLNGFEEIFSFIPNENTVKILSIIAFVLFGTFMGIGFVDPKTAPQSIAAGSAWIGLFVGKR